MKPDTVLVYHSLFTREELAGALQGRRRRQGRIERVKNAHPAR